MGVVLPRLGSGRLPDGPWLCPGRWQDPGATAAYQLRPQGYVDARRHPGPDGPEPARGHAQPHTARAPRLRRAILQVVHHEITMSRQTSAIKLVLVADREQPEEVQPSLQARQP